MVVALSLTNACVAVHAAPPAAADLIVTGAQIFTVDNARTWAHALVIKDGKIIYVGEDKPAMAFAGVETKKIALQGEMILPGFHDSHIHPIDSGIELSHCRLDDASSKEEVLQTIEKYSKAHPDDKWVLGGGWSLPLFPGACPQAVDLDKIIPDRPAYFISQDAHSAWVNSAALKLAHVNKSTPNPPRGIIERGENGEPNGTLREYATDLVARYVPEPTPEQRQEGLLRSLKIANSFGITSMQDANADENALKTYTDVARLKRLTVRVVAAQHVNPSLGAAQVKNLVALKERYRSAFLRPTSAKIFVDGVVETHTAALTSPYSDEPESTGLLNFKTVLLNEVVEELDRNNFQVHYHAIGDEAVNQALNSIELARSKNGPGDNRHHIAHLELIKPSDLSRFRQLNVVANFQPFWAYRDAYITQCTEPLLGPERTSRLYQLNSVMKTGAVVAAGSDWSVTTMNPLDAMQVAVTRKGLNDTNGASWSAGECVSLPQIIAAYTINGAWLNHQEDVTGSLQVGKDADFIVLDKNLFDVAPEAIHNVKVLLTFFKGELVYGRNLSQ